MSYPAFSWLFCSYCLVITVMLSKFCHCVVPCDCHFFPVIATNVPDRVLGDCPDPEILGNWFWESVWRGSCPSQGGSDRAWFGKKAAVESQQDGVNMSEKCSLLIPDVTQAESAANRVKICVHTSWLLLYTLISIVHLSLYECVTVVFF